VRTYDAPRTSPSPGVGSVTGYDRTGRQSPAPSGLGGPSGRIAPSPSTPARGTAAATPNVVDLTGSARAPRVRFPELGSSARGPAARRGEALSGSGTPSRSRGTGTYDETRTRAVADGLESARQRQVDDDGLRTRYRGPANDRGATGGLSARERDARVEPSTPAERARRAPGSVRLRQAYGDDQSGLEARRSALLRRGETTTDRVRGGSTGAADGRRVGRLAPALPAADPAVEKARRGASIATGVAVDVGLGVTVGVFGGSSGAFCGTGYPYYGCGYGSGYGNNCGWDPGWSWGFSFCWSWGSSFWSPYCFGYSPWWRSPYYCNWYSPAFYYPVYYSYPVYSAYSEPVYYEAAPSQTTYVEEQVPVAGEAAVAATETFPSPDADLQAALSRAASYYLNLGDHAFRDGRYADAVHFYAKAVEYAPDQGVLYLILSDALFATGDYHYAAYALRKAVELDPSLFDAPVDKRTFYTDPEDFDRQLATLELYLQDHFIDDDARLVLAANYLFGDRPAAAVDLLQESFSESLRGSPAGQRVLESARAIQYGR
jgi:hypothetical protein